jgi:hypothetical protein
VGLESASLTSCCNKFPYIRSHPKWFSPSKPSSNPSHRLNAATPLCCRPRQANCPGRIARVRHSHWCFPRHLRYSRDPHTPSPRLEEERSPPPAALTDHCHHKVGKTSSPHCPGAVGPNRIVLVPRSSSLTLLTVGHGYHRLWLRQH